MSENASGGTDHGTAGPVLLAGPAVQPGLIGPYPSLTDLDAGDLKAAVDFRRVYASVLGGLARSALRRGTRRVIRAAPAAPSVRSLGFPQGWARPAGGIEAGSESPAPRERPST